jgi:hypothetical protein
VSKPRTAAKDRLRYERFFRDKVWKGKPPPVDAFEPVAQLITPNPPIWLKEHLRRWLPMCPYAAEILQPSRAEMRAALTKVAEAASVLVTALRSSAIVEFLDLGADVPLRAPGNLQAALTDLRDRAAAASRSRALVDSKGRTRAGRGRALPKAGTSAKTYCALLIAETWLYFRRDYPPPGNKEADKAADIYWSLFGGERESWGTDKLIAWRRHFREASDDQSQETKKLREEYQRHLRESAHQAQVHEDPSQGGT